MACRRNKGQAIQIVRLEGEGRFSLDSDALKKILLADDVKNLPVVVVSVAGPFRTGKSFLLNFFLRYMRNRTQGDWMADSNAPLEGFLWRGGSNRETTGIWMWNEVFVVTTAEGRKVAVLFLDTQGMFDCHSTTGDGAKIFALSMMASSVQIYNLSQNIGEDHLQHLQLFTQYGKLALRETGEKPFQKLVFLVRDWQWHSEWEYGFTGGKGLAEERLRITEGQAAELKSLRRDIYSSFEEIWCFLMPYPGKKVTSVKTFDGRLSDIHGDFKTQLRNLVSSLLQPTTSVVKRINGDIISCQDLLDHLQIYAEMFSRDGLPEPKSMFEAAVEKNNSKAVYKAIDKYRKDMEKVFHEGKPYLDSCRLQEEHQRGRESAVLEFECTPKLGGVARSRQYKDRLENMITQEFKSFFERNEGERIKANEKKIMAEAQQTARRIRERDEPRVLRMQIASILGGVAFLAAQFTPVGPLLNGALAVAEASALYVTGEALWAANEDAHSYQRLPYS